MYFLFIVPILRTLFIATTFVLPLYASSSPQGNWTNPQAPDFKSTFSQGDSISIKWTSGLEPWFSHYCSECNTTNVELWITAEDNSSPQQIGSGIDIKSTLSYPWTINITASSPQSSWVFRFTPSLEEFQEDNQQISSPIFYIDNTVSSSTTTATSSQQTTSSNKVATQGTPTQTTSSSSSASNSTTASPTAISSSSTKKLSSGAIAGICVGVVLLVLAICFIWHIVYGSKKKSSASQFGISKLSPGHSYQSTMQELPEETAIQELAGEVARHELASEPLRHPY